MRHFHKLTVIICSIVLSGLAFGCAQDTTPKQGPYSVAREALVDELLQCRESISDCLTSATGISDIADCRDEFENCMTTVTDAADAAVSDMAACQDAAVDCVADAKSMSDVGACREDYMACAEDLVPDVSQIPDILDLPDLGDLPDAEAVITCGQDLRDCVTGGGSVVECADAARECLGAELPVDLPDIKLPDGLPDIPNPEDVLACSESLADCVTNGGSVMECADQARDCLGVELPVDLPDGLLPDVTLPDVNGGAECMTSLADCVAGGGRIMDCADQARECAAATLPDITLPDLGGLPGMGGLPGIGNLDPVGNINGGIDCVQTLAECVTGGGSIMDCADEARTCLMDQLPL
jgi:hypothetical protein